MGAVAARILLGGVFLYAGGSKIVDPPGFAHELSNYRLLPDMAVAPIALALPWLEVLCGGLLVAGVWRRESALILAGLLVVFVGALSIDLARGIPVDCGCFGGAKPARSPAERFADMRLAIGRDV
ncbi:MAG: MauE/DoxX family redox-associated membrane protein, partial [Acidobacteriota bacterium]